MAFVPNPNAARIVVEGELAGFPIVNVHHVQMANPDNTADLLAAGSLVANAFVDNILPLLSNDYAFTGYTAYSLTSESAPVIQNVASPPIVGGVGVDTNGRGVAIVVTKRSGSRGRTGRGRTYYGGIPDDALIDGALSGAAETAWIAAITAFLVQVNTGSVVYAIYSQQEGGVPRTTGVLRPVTALELRTGVPGSQRRRNHREATA